MPDPMPDHHDAPPPEDFVQSVGRALRVLEVVTARPGIPVKAIARSCGLNLSTTYHLARTLAYEGYLERLPDGTYSVGTEVSRRFYDVLGALHPPPEARAVLRRLAEATGLSAYLGRLSGGQVVVAEYAEGPGSPYLEDFERGLTVSAHATALGKALLLAMPRRDRRDFLREHGLRPFTARTATEEESLEAQLALLDADGVVVEHGEFRDGVSCAAKLLPRKLGDAHWAIVVSTRGEDVAGPVCEELSIAASVLAGPRAV